MRIGDLALIEGIYSDRRKIPSVVCGKNAPAIFDELRAITGSALT